MEIGGKTAIVTGSGSGVGRAIALEFARQGANVVCCARRKDKISETVALIEKEGGRGLAIPTDVTRKDLVERMVAETIKHFGQIDVLVNNAGSFQAIGGVWEIDPEVWWHDVTVNLYGPLLCCHTVLPHMMEKDEGIIINLSGGGAGGPFPGGTGYSCSKAALMRLTDGLAGEMKKIGSSILVLAIGPGLVRTEMTEYQAEVPEGLKWVPSTKEYLDTERDRPAEDCAKAAVELIRIACPQLSGRIFHAEMDYSEIAKRIEEIYREDLFVIRSRQ